MNCDTCNGNNGYFTLIVFRLSSTTITYFQLTPMIWLSVHPSNIFKENNMQFMCYVTPTNRARDMHLPSYECRLTSYLLINLISFHTLPASAGSTWKLHFFHVKITYYFVSSLLVDHLISNYAQWTLLEDTHFHKIMYYF